MRGRVATMIAMWIDVQGTRSKQRRMGEEKRNQNVGLNIICGKNRTLCQKALNFT